MVNHRVFFPSKIKITYIVLEILLNNLSGFIFNRSRFEIITKRHLYWSWTNSCVIPNFLYSAEIFDTPPYTWQSDACSKDLWPRVCISQQWVESVVWSRDQVRVNVVPSEGETKPMEVRWSQRAAWITNCSLFPAPLSCDSQRQTAGPAAAPYM